nr:hypothetical protein CFP56_07986 [Quercus suber]
MAHYKCATVHDSRRMGMIIAGLGSPAPSPVSWLNPSSRIHMYTPACCPRKLQSQQLPAATVEPPSLLVTRATQLRPGYPFPTSSRPNLPPAQHRTHGNAAAFPSAGDTTFQGTGMLAVYWIASATMALKSPLMPSPTTGGISSAFSPYSDPPTSPYPSSFPNPDHSSRSSANSDTLAPPPSPYPQQIEPSPVDSNGTDIEEDAQEEQQAVDDDGDMRFPSDSAVEEGALSPEIEPRVEKINTQLPLRFRSDSGEDAPQSVIHAPDGFKKFDDNKSTRLSDRAANTVVSPNTPDALISPQERVRHDCDPDCVIATKLWLAETITNIARQHRRAASNGSLHTTGPDTTRARGGMEAQKPSHIQSRRSFSHVNLHLNSYLTHRVDIPEGFDRDDPDDETEGPDTAGLIGEGRLSQAMQQRLKDTEEEVSALRAALSECWTLCNTLANLSSSHRSRTFKFSGGQKEVQEQAWQSCWRLCRSLYESKDEDHATQVLPTLELCRDFCQALFEVRQKGDAGSDSVLRVSFELNNHLYNTQDRSLPDAFIERTLDFYITLCHRLMKQQTSLPEETDALLRACWSLAEMLFNLRQSSREGKTPDEELLGSAVQACWELCDLFREGWTQIRPDRNTPRPSQMTFPSSKPPSYSSLPSSTRSDLRSNSSLSNRQHITESSIPPETPTTIFDDNTSAASSPESVTAPNILVLGPSSTSGSVRGTHHDRWSSNTSVRSGYSESASSQRSSSTETATTEEQHLLRLRYLLLKAGMHTGFSRNLGPNLSSFVLKLPDNAFGTLPWQMTVLNYYKKLVTNDKSMVTAHTLPSRSFTAKEMARSIQWLGLSEKWAWMRDLYRLVFGFGLDEVERRGGALHV